MINTKISALSIVAVLTLAPLTAGCIKTDTAIKAGKTVLDVSDAICDTLLANDVDDETVQIICKYVDKADGLSHVFMAKVPAPQAAKMGLRSPKYASKPAQAPSCAPSTSASAR